MTERQPTGCGPAGRRFLGVCSDARKAWGGAQLTTMVRLERIERVRSVLCSGQASAIAGVLGEMAGPLHPGDPARAGSPMTANGTKLAQAVLEAVLEAALRTSPAASAGLSQASGGAISGAGMLDVEHLKVLLVRWIDHGRLEHSGQTDVGDQAARIAEFLATQTRSDDVQAQAALRLACVAMAAPAVELAGIVAGLEPSQIEAMRVRAATDTPASVTSPSGLPPDAQVNSPMSRGELDDLDLQRASERLAHMGGHRGAPGPVVMRT